MILVKLSAAKSYQFSLLSAPALYFSSFVEKSLLNCQFAKVLAIHSSIQKPHLNQKQKLNKKSIANMSSSSIESKFGLHSKYKGLEKNVWVEFVAFVAANKDVLNLGQGFPDFHPAEEVTTNLAKICSNKADPLLHQYTRSYGHKRLVDGLAKMYGTLIGREINPLTEVLVTVGAYGSLFATFMSMVGPGDEVILIEPHYDCYRPIVLLAGGTPKHISLKQRNPKDQTSAAWALDMTELERMFNEKTKMIVVNTPNNPLGKVYSRAELTAIGELCKKYNVVCIADEVYEMNVFPEHEHVRMASLPGMWERTITIGSSGKAFSLTGWKTGWSYGPAHLMKNLFVAHQSCVYTCNTPCQEALAIAIEKEIPLLGTKDSFFYKLGADLKMRCDIFEKSVRKAGFIPIIPEAGAFLCADWSPLEPKVDLSTEKDTDVDYKFVKWFARNWKVLGIPPSAFYSEPHKHESSHLIRFCFYKKEETLKVADDLLTKWAIANNIRA